MNGASTPLDPDTYLESIARDSQRFVTVLSFVDASAPVPTCPGWTARHLLDHLAVVQHHWSVVVREGIVEDDEASSVTERFPLPDAEGHEGALDLARQATKDLVEALHGRCPEDAVWSWSADRTVGFTYRRQAHEACVHRIDAELTAAPDGRARTMVDPMLAADGVDEILRLVDEFTPDAAEGNGSLVRIVASDTGLTWLARAGEDGLTVHDTDPADGTVRPSAILTGTAEDLLCAFWGRPTVADLHRTGDLVLLAAFERIMTSRPGG